VYNCSFHYKEELFLVQVGEETRRKGEETNLPERNTFALGARRREERRKKLCR